MRLNLGCGNDIREGYTNVDFRELPGVDVVADLSQFPWPFDDGSAEEILLLDFLEHFPYAMTQAILLECYRVLDANGKLVIQVPDGLHTTRALIQEGDYDCNRCGSRMYRPERDDGDGSGYAASNYPRCQKCGQSADEISEAANGRLYGGQDYPGNFHHTCFTKTRLRLKAKTAGFKDMTDLSVADTEHLWKNWTIKMTFDKDDLW